ncbi:hypothetical protein ACLHDF_18540 [Priestia aryabhattai]|uniref:hypothetical protein n=1 Tax=Priestia megaterium TaxID=1404 RepID=UPI0039B8A4D0
MFYSNFYTPFNHAFYPYFMPSFGRPTGYVLSAEGEVDNWWGNYPLGNPAKAPKHLPYGGVFQGVGGPIPTAGSLVPYSLRTY